MSEVKLGKVFVIEGADGSGKTGTAKALVERFNSEGMNFTYLRDPGSSAFGESVRDIVRSADIEPYTQLLMYSACRHEMVMKHLIPLIKEGKNVIIDRFTLSTVVYQGFLDNLMDEVNALIQMQLQQVSLVMEPFKLNVIYLHVHPDVSRQRTQARLTDTPDRSETKDDEFTVKLIDAYKELIDRYNERYGEGFIPVIYTSYKDQATVIDECHDVIVNILTKQN